MRDGEATKDEQLRDVTKAELAAEAPEDGVEDDFGWVLEIIENGASALVEAPAAGCAEEAGEVEGGGAHSPRCLM